MLVIIDSDEATNGLTKDIRKGLIGPLAESQPVCMVRWQRGSFKDESWYASFSKTLTKSKSCDARTQNGDSWHWRVVLWTTHSSPKVQHGAFLAINHILESAQDGYDGMFFAPINFISDDAKLFRRLLDRAGFKHVSIDSSLPVFLAAH